MSTLPGAISYFASPPRLSFPRSYIDSVVVKGDFSTDPFLDGNVIQFDSLAGYTYRLAITVNFFVWSSNGWTLDHVFNDAMSSIDCHLFPCFDFCDVTFVNIINQRARSIVVHPFALGSDVRVVPLPPAPPGYWLPGGVWGAL